GIARGLLEGLGDRTGDLDDGEGRRDAYRADVAAVDPPAPADHREEPASVGALDLAPRDAEGDPVALARIATSGGPRTRPNLARSARGLAAPGRARVGAHLRRMDGRHVT